MTWIQTYTGRAFRPFEPDPNTVSIADIAHALALKCRFNGHCKRFYSVAEHSLHCKAILSGRVPRCEVTKTEADEATNYRSVSLQLHALLHDAHEAYIPDVARPLKGGICVQWFGDIITFRQWEQALKHVIFEGLGLDALMDSAEINVADGQLLVTEARDLMSDPPEPWGVNFNPMPYFKLSEQEPQTWLTIKLEFLRHYKELKKEWLTLRAKMTGEDPPDSNVLDTLIDEE